MTTDYDAELRRITRTLSEIAHTLESLDDSAARVRRVLGLIQHCVPYQQCALLKAPPGRPQELFVVPDPPPVAIEGLRNRLIGLVRLMAEADEIGRSTGPVPHLAVPVMGLDQIIGVLRVEPPPDVQYEAQHLRLFSVIAAQLGAYLTTLHLREDEAARTRELAAAHDFQQLLSGVVTHDLRNPLTVIMSVASSMLRAPQSEQHAKALKKILANVRSADRIINDLMDVTRVRATGSLLITVKPVKLGLLLREVVENARLAHPGRELELVMPAGEAVSGEWDPERLAQVVTNLINNAFVHGQDGSPVRVELRRDEGGVIVSVHNQGPPIPDELLPIIFDPFRQGHRNPYRSGRSGLGLGLYIVAQIVRAHGGRVDIRSIADEGTTFMVRLPRVAQKPERPVGQESPPLPKDVLIIEDTPEVRQLLSEVLAAKGYTVWQAENGLQGLETLRQLGRPCLVLLDLVMPVMDGWEFQRQLRADPQLRGTRVIVVSGSGEHQSLPEQVEAFLPKPVDLPRLGALLQGISAPDAS